MDQAVDILKRNRPPVHYGVVLTFDDGYRSNVKDALPILRKYGAPMTVFVPVSNVNNRKPLWFDRLDYALNVSKEVSHKFNIGRKSYCFVGSTRADLSRSYTKFRKLIKKELMDEGDFVLKIEEIISYYERVNGKRLDDIFESDPWSSLLTWEDMLAVQGSDVCFGSHAMDHIRLGRLPAEVLRYQLAESKRQIEDRTGRTCKYLAYPDGFFSSKAAAIARECGYSAAATTEYGTNKIGCDLMSLKRIALPPVASELELLARVSGYSHMQAISDLFALAVA